MIPHQSAMIMSIFIEIVALFLLRKSESKIKSVVQVAYATDTASTTIWRQSLFTEKRKEFAKWPQKKIKYWHKYCAKKRGIVQRDCVQRSQQTYRPLTTLWSVCSRWSMTSERSTDSLAVEENKKLLLNKNTV